MREPKSNPLIWKKWMKNLLIPKRVYNALLKMTKKSRVVLTFFQKWPRNLESLSETMDIGNP